MLGAFSGDFTVVANDVIMQRTQRCLGLSDTRQLNQYIVIWPARALRALEASQLLGSALGTHTKFQLEILIRSTVSAMHKFQENILESSRNISETTPWWCKAAFTLYATRRDATRLGRVIGFQWNQQDRSHYARHDATARDFVARIGSCTQIIAQSRVASATPSVLATMQRNPFPRIVTRLTRIRRKYWSIVFE